MKKEKFDHILKLAAFLLPFYFVFYVPPDESFAKILNRYVIFGFCFYALAGVVVLAIGTLS